MENTATEEKTKQNGMQKLTPPEMEKTLADNVLNRIKIFTQTGALKLPENYSAPNSLKLAWLMLQQTVNKAKVPVLDVCKKESIANALLEMCIQGLNPMKKQCYFVAYGDKLTMQRSYQGSIAVAKRVSTTQSVHAQVIYTNDVFEYTVDTGSGRKTVTKHEQKMENIDLNKIRGAYAIAVFEDGTSNMEVMNILQIKKAWAQGFGGGNTDAHQNFTDEMCKKTVINRLCKGIINDSDDSALFKNSDQDGETETVEATVIEEIKENANLTELDIAAGSESSETHAGQANEKTDQQETTQGQPKEEKKKPNF